MTEASEIERTSVDRVDDIPRTLRALKQAVQEALWRHKVSGNPVAIWRNGRVEWIRPEDIPEPAQATHSAP